MKKVWAQKEYLAFGVVIVLFVFVSLTSMSSIHQLQGNARVVNYVGIVRGATQKLIKEEIMGWYLSQEDASFREQSDWYPDDALIERLDSIVTNLLTGEGPHELVVLRDETYLANMRQVQAHWAVLRGLIQEVREGADPHELFESSQRYFELVNDTVFSAEAYSERQVSRINSILLFVNGVFVGLILIALALYVRSLAERRRVDALGQIAYVDPLTQMDNRASCERLIERLQTEHQDVDIAVFMFDMNNLKLTNDALGHQGGDRIIAAFAGALKAAAAGRGFVGRFGGDEFLAVFQPGGEEAAESFLAEVRERVEQYNAAQAGELEQIHYAAGYVIANIRTQDMEDMIHEADNQMYADKRKRKGT